MDSILINSSAQIASSNFCFNKDDFMKNDFNVEHFVVECRRHVPLESLRDDLAVYMKVLQNSMIELINKDYADFVNLSSNLVGMDKSIGNLSDPLRQLQTNIESVKQLLDDAINAAENKMKERANIKARKETLQVLMDIVALVEKVEVLLGVRNDANTSNVPTGSNSSTSGLTLERIASEFIKLQFLTNHSSIVENQLINTIKPRIAVISGSLQYCLENHFRDALTSGNSESLRQCLRAYSIIDKIRDVEELFRRLTVKPYMAQILTEDHIRREGLVATYQAVLDFIPKYCRVIMDITSGLGSRSDFIRGYDFLANAVWPEIVSCIETGISSIFAPGNPNIFFEKYTQSIEFVEQFEVSCGNQASVKRLRAHPAYAVFMTKWSLPVYFQIRFQEIGGVLESALSTPFVPSTATDVPFKLAVTASLWQCVHQCWHQSVFVPALCHRFWKLTVQLFSRFSQALAEVADAEVARKAGKGNEERRVDDSAAVVTGAGTNGNTVNGSAESQRLTVAVAVNIVADLEQLSHMASAFFETVVRPPIEAQGLKDVTVFRESIEEAVSQLLLLRPRFLQFIVDELCSQCLVTVKQVNDIPRLYRKTNREVPTKSSSYMTMLLKPLVSFLQEHGSAISGASSEKCIADVVIVVAEQYHSVTVELLTSVRKMEESLKRLKRAKTSSTAQLDGKGGADDDRGKTTTDDDKIRIQLSLDAQEFYNQVVGLRINAKDIVPLTQLQQTIQEAIAGSA